METLAELLGGDRRSADLAVRVPGDPPVEYTYKEFVTTAWKTANFFRHRGVHEGATVAVVDDQAASAVLALFGAAQLGARTRFVAPLDADESSPAVEARLLVGPGETVLSYGLPPGGTRVAYTAGTDGVDDPAVEAFGRSVWSENPTRPPESVDPGGPVLVADGGTASHGALLGAAEDAAAALEAGDCVVVGAPLGRPGTVVAGVLAPLLAGATVVLGEAPSAGADGSSGSADTQRVVDEAASERWGAAITDV
jgi:hypothetical protein